MLQLSTRKDILIFLLPCVFLFCLLSAAELTPFQEEAELYRKQGLQFQRQGRLDEAMACYQKAIVLDPDFVSVYNDLGIIYEARGESDKAEEVYLSALEIDPNYPNLYSNLAMLYESKQEYERAATFWKKRIELGDSEDAWTEKAKERLAALSVSLSELKLEPEHFQEVAEEELSSVVSINNKVKKSKYSVEQKRLFSQAKRLYEEAEYEKALKTIVSVLSLNPGNEQARLLRDKINARLIEQERRLILPEDGIF